MKSRILAFIAIAAMSVISPANADVDTAEDMLSKCESELFVENIYCWVYLSGVNDAHEPMRVYFEGKGGIFCIPDGVFALQLGKIFIKYANEHPEELHFTAAVAVDAFRKAFPANR